jgi:hypothetical protein
VVFVLSGVRVPHSVSSAYQSRLLIHWHQPLCHSSQILRSCRQQELILGTAQSTQSQPVELKDALEMGEQHFNLLALSPGSLEGIGFSDLSSHVSCALMDAAYDLSVWGVGTTMRFSWADCAVF